MSSKNEVKNVVKNSFNSDDSSGAVNDTHSSVKIYKIREELSMALNNWQDIESNPSKTPAKKEHSLPSPRKKKLLKEIKLQLESL